MPQVRVPAWKCNRCRKIWYTGKKKKPKRCSRCKSPCWDLTSKEYEKVRKPWLSGPRKEKT